jgi:hypothetical protein
MDSKVNYKIQDGFKPPFALGKTLSMLPYKGKGPLHFFLAWEEDLGKSIF